MKQEMYLKHSRPKGPIVAFYKLHKPATPLPQYKHPDRAFYIFGPEDGTLGQSVTGWCRDIIYVPTIFCMNLAAAVNVVLYDRMAKRGESHETTYRDS